jgi:DNA-binding response OmpR family regulator
MRILIAEDDKTTARLLRGSLVADGWTVDSVSDGPAALAALQANDAPEIALLDWMLPGGVDGLDVCRGVRDMRRPAPTYIILLTGRSGVADVVRGLEAGADDYLVKPCNPAELCARLHAAARVVDLQHSLLRHVRDLEAALASVKTLSGLLPICGYCKSIRDDSDYWHRVEEYLTAHSAAQFTHGICPTCMARVMSDERLA